MEAPHATRSGRALGTMALFTLLCGGAVGAKAWSEHAGQTMMEPRAMETRILPCGTGASEPMVAESPQGGTTCPGAAETGCNSKQVADDSEPSI
ncbi:MAG: hypothetical protein AB7K52_09355 [Phycisphaerales bacterium]